MEEPDFCLICGKRLKKLIYEPEIKFAYHQTCFNKMIKDIKNFDEKLAIKKYGYKPLYCGLTKEQVEAGEKLIVEFD